MLCVCAVWSREFALCGVVSFESSAHMLYCLLTTESSTAPPTSKLQPSSVSCTCFTCFYLNFRSSICQLIQKTVCISELSMSCHVSYDYVMEVHQTGCQWCLKANRSVAVNVYVHDLLCETVIKFLLPGQTHFATMPLEAFIADFEPVKE